MIRKVEGCHDRPAEYTTSLTTRVLMIIGGALAILSGVLIITSGYRVQGLLISVLRLAEQKFGSDLPGYLRTITTFSIVALAFLISLGGILVVIGGIIILLRHIFIGRIFIGLGGGVGFLGLLIAFGITFFSSGISAILMHLDYWIGVILASIASHLAKMSR